MFVKGQSVVQKAPILISGVVSGFQVDQNTGELQVLVTYVDLDGVEGHRHFALSDLEAGE